MARMAGAQMVPSTHPLFAEVKAFYKSSATQSVQILPDCPLYARFAAGADAAPPATPLTKEQARERLTAAFSARDAAKTAQDAYDAAKAALATLNAALMEANDAVAVTMRTFAEVVPVGRTFYFRGEQWTHAKGTILAVGADAIDFDEPAAPPAAPPAASSAASPAAPPAAPAKPKK